MNFKTVSLKCEVCDWYTQVQSINDNRERNEELIPLDNSQIISSSIRFTMTKKQI